MTLTLNFERVAECKDANLEVAAYQGQQGQMQSCRFKSCRAHFILDKYIKAAIIFI